jgi:hypothetical protein
LRNSFLCVWRFAVIVRESFGFSLAKECYSMKLDLLTDATGAKDIEMSLTNSNENDREESNDPDYDEDEDQLEEEQEEQIGEIATNHVF